MKRIIIISTSLLAFVSISGSAFAGVIGNYDNDGGWGVDCGKAGCFGFNYNYTDSTSTTTTYQEPSDGSDDDPICESKTYEMTCGWVEECEQVLYAGCGAFYIDECYDVPDYEECIVEIQGDEGSGTSNEGGADSSEGTDGGDSGDSGGTTGGSTAPPASGQGSGAPTGSGSSGEGSVKNEVEETQNNVYKPQAPATGGLTATTQSTGKSISSTKLKKSARRKKAKRRSAVK